MQRLKILLLSFIIASNLHAQNKLRIEQGTHIDTKRFFYGIETEIGVAKYCTIPSEEGASECRTSADYAPSIAMGIHGVTGYHCNKYIQIYSSPGIIFTHGTFHLIQAENDTEISQKTKSYIIDLPLKVKISGTRMTNVRPSLSIGTGYMFLISPHETNTTRTTKEQLNLSSHHAYISSEIGLDIYTPYIKISPSIKYIRTITSALTQNKEDTTLWSIHIKNMYISGIFFSIRFQ